MSETTGLEKIINCIDGCITEILDKNNEELTPETYEDLLICSTLCDRLLNYDYFSESENILNASKLSTRVIRWWEKKQKKELKEKRKDLKKLFRLIISNSEEI